VRINNVMFNEQTLGSGGSAVIAIQGKPTAFGLDQNYPNPFNPTTTIAYRVPDDGAMVSIEIYNMTGQLVRTLVHSTHDAGEYHIVWDATTDGRSKVGSGVYLVRISSDKFTSVRKMVLLK
jgi:flagellar hook assembly protein FlgD